MFNLDMEYKGGKVYMGIKQTTCIFKEETHQYFLVDVATGEYIKELISVTTLMAKHGLAPNYDGVPSEILKAKAEYGKLVHSEIEAYITNGTIGFTQELQQFIDYCHENKVKPTNSEFIVHNDLVAGTADFKGIISPEKYTLLGDFKTTATLHKEAVRWQLSIYAYLLGEKFDELTAFHFAEGGLKVVAVDPIPTEEIEKLFEAERNGEIYQARQLEIAENVTMQLIRFEQTIKQIELQKKQAEADAAKFKNMIIKAMREQGVSLFENEFIRIKYTAPTTQTRIDTEKLKNELPEIAKKYVKTSNIKDKITITLKG